MNWIRVWNVFASAILSGLLGMGSAKVIADLNGKGNLALIGWVK